MAQGMAMAGASSWAEGEGGEPLNDMFPGLVDRLEADAENRIGKRRLVEERWLNDLAQFEGRDSVAIVSQLAAEERSTATVNITRAKCNTFESKLFDLLFPSDDRNWGLNPTPVAETVMELKRLNGEVGRLTALANLEEDDEAAEGERQEADALAQKVAELETEQQEARERSELMAAEIEDNLVECDYATECRNVIHDGTTAGTGILKGPIRLSERVRSSWLKEDGGVYRLKYKADNGDRFVYQHVSYWNVFPNPTARSFDSVVSWMERYIWSERDLRDFSRKPGVDQDAVRRLLDNGPTGTLPNYMTEVDSIADETQTHFGDNVFTVWEYRGPLESEEMENLVAMLAEQSIEQQDGEDGETPQVAVEIDPLVQMDAVVWFCQGEILRVAINHMDDNAPIYSVFQIEKSMARMWGVGIPYLMRTQSDIVQDSWRNMLDNANLGAFPQTEVDLSIVQRADGGENRIEPFAVWERIKSGTAKGLIFHEVPIYQEHYAAIIQMAMQFIDTETNISVLASGEQGQVSRTAGGMALLMNATNTVFRRVVTNFDDGITKPVINRAYYFLMQFSEREEIKGDYTIQARGSSVLLVREVQAQNLLLLAGQLSQDPELRKHFKMRQILKKLVQSMMLSSDDVLKTMAEIEADEAAEMQAAAEAPPDPALLKLETDRERSMMENETKLIMAQMNLETELMKLVAQRQISMAQAQYRLAEVKELAASRERMFSAEAAIEGRQPPDAPGSGGWLS